MTRTEDMLERYGEVCTQAMAAHILGRTAPTIRNMLKDGRLATACGGKMVDVRSIIDYILRKPNPASEERRQRAMDHIRIANERRKGRETP